MCSSDLIQNKRIETDTVKCKTVDVSINNDHKHSYFLVNYDKKLLKSRVSDEVEVDYNGYVRSVILNADRRIVCFSPPMCEPRSKSQDEFNYSEVKFAEEFVEGTMVNLFYNPSNDVQGWEFSTRNMISPDRKSTRLNSSH